MKDRRTYLVTVEADFDLDFDWQFQADTQGVEVDAAFEVTIEKTKCRFCGCTATESVLRASTAEYVHTCHFHLYKAGATGASRPLMLTTQNQPHPEAPIAGAGMEVAIPR